MIESLVRLLGARQDARDGARDYVLEQPLSKGAQAEVWLARGRCGKVAVKKYATLNPGVALQQRVQGHPNIAKIIEVFTTATSCEVVEEFVHGVELCDHVPEGKGLSLPAALAIFRQLASAVQHMHHHGVAHRDLKLENVMLSSSGAVMVIDFGLAALATDPRARDRGLGTPYTMAPEVLAPTSAQRGPPDHRAQDVWALGIILLYLLTGRVLFQQAGPGDVGFTRLMAHPGKWAGLPGPVSLLLTGLLCVDPGARWTIHQVMTCLVMGRVAAVSWVGPGLAPQLPPPTGVMFRPSGLGQGARQGDAVLGS